MKRVVLVISALLLSATGVFLVGQAQTLPGTSADRIGFPTGYRDTFKQVYAIDNNQNQQIRVIWANDVAQKVDPAQPWNFPYGSILLFEDYPTVPDADGNPTLDEGGRFVRGPLRTIFAMKKERGYGAEYGAVRNGEWEYVSYRPDGTFATAPEASGACALCHMNASSAALSNNLPHINAKNDYVFRVENFFAGGSGATPDGVMLNYIFVPKVIHATAGVPLTIYNDDDVVHTIVADDGSWASSFMGKGGSYTVKFDKAGEIPIHCSLHNRMRAKIVVDAPGAPTTNDVLNYSHASR